MSFERINFNIKSDLLQKVNRFCSNGYGRSALLNYLIAQALNDKNAMKLLEELETKRKDRE